MPSWTVISRIVRDGKEYLPGDRIDLTRKEVIALCLRKAFCIYIPDWKMVQDIRDALAEIHMKNKEKTLKNRAIDNSLKPSIVDELLKDERQRYT